MLKLIALTSLAMVAFAANSVFTRIALVETEIGPIMFTAIRLTTGALMLLLIVAIHKRSWTYPKGSGSTNGSFALFFYAIFFTFAYLSLGAGLGALVLFASVQITMIIWAIVKGERPSPIEIVGILLAFGAFVYLVSPGLVAPDPIGTGLMVASGISWGVYSLLGRGSKNPLEDTMGNFVRTLPLILGVTLGLAFVSNMWPTDPKGILFAALSGALASGVGYAIWYLILPQLARTSAGVVQLTVPAIAAAGGILFLGEELSVRFIIASTLILLGVALATMFKKQS
jgi:drug/metabolite transporter (DMT)-like permease